MFTFCTSTALLGVISILGYYPSGFVISDGKRVNTTIGLSTDFGTDCKTDKDLKRILSESIFFLYIINPVLRVKEEFEYELQKVNLTNAEIESNNLYK